MLREILNRQKEMQLISNIEVNQILFYEIKYEHNNLSNLNL